MKEPHYVIHSKQTYTYICCPYLHSLLSLWNSCFEIDSGWVFIILLYSSIIYNFWNVCKDIAVSLSLSPSLTPSPSLCPPPAPLHIGKHFSLSLSQMFTGEEASCQVSSNPMERSTQQQPENGIWPTASKDPRPSVQQPKRNWGPSTAGEETWKWLFQPQSSPEVPAAPSNILTTTSWESMHETTQLRWSQTPDRQKLWDNKCLLV